MEKKLASGLLFFNSDSEKIYSTKNYLEKISLIIRLFLV